jgi:hypothetical protein
LLIGIEEVSPEKQAQCLSALFFVYLYIAASGPLEEENFADAAEN